jgi:dihydrofolate synthase/folylpolyglutamate synthase
MSLPVSVDPDSSRQEAARRFLYGRINYERARTVPYCARNFKLDRMRELLDRLGNPQNAYPIAHVAGTKGKGSTAAMLGAVLSASGRRTGVFTSPHLDRVEQRMTIDGQPCPPAQLVELVERLSPVVEEMDRAASRRDPAEHGPTYFEVVTAIALTYFARHPVQAAVLEVGLGGRLDSTNLCRPLVSVITSISLDHTRQLGHTLESIAGEKAGIVKPGVPVVSGVLDPGPREVIRKICRRQGCRLVELGVHFDFDYHPPRRLESAASTGTMDFRYTGQDRQHAYRNLSLRLLGRHQAANAAVALAVVAELRQIGWEIPEQAIRAGLADLDWPARVELLARRPAIVIDSAHNAASIDALLCVLDECFSVRRRLLVFATTHDKDVRGMLSRLLARFDQVILTRYLNNPRAVPPEELAEMAAELTGQEYPVCQDPADAWKQALASAAADDLICVTGSFFIAAEIRHHILARPANGAKDDACPALGGGHSLPDG